MSTIIEKTAVIEPGSFIGEKCYIGHFAVIRHKAIIRDCSHIRAHCFIAEGAEIKEHTQVMQFSNICRDALIESECFIGMGCMLTNTRKIAYRRSYEDVCEPPIIRRAARIGARVTILPGVEIGENALIGAGSVVTKNVPPCWVAVGNPAILVREVGKDEII